MIHDAQAHSWVYISLHWYIMAIKFPFKLSQNGWILCHEYRNRGQVCIWLPSTLKHIQPFGGRGEDALLIFPTSKISLHTEAALQVEIPCCLSAFVSYWAEMAPWKQLGASECGAPRDGGPQNCLALGPAAPVLPCSQAVAIWSTKFCFPHAGSLSSENVVSWKLPQQQFRC